MGKLCLVCDEEASVKCDGCVQVLYCGEEHRKSHLSQHKTQCKPYTVSTNTKYGRYLVTSRDVRRGEVLLRESPVLVGPRVDSPPVCLQCFAPLYPTVPRCRRCGVPPLCHHCHHNTLDCRFFSSLSQEQRELCVQANNQYILPLRVLLNIREEGGDERFRRILEMESHLESRRGGDVWFIHQKNVVELLQCCGLIGGDKEDTDLIQHICGVLDVNSFEVRGAVGVGLRLRGVYLDPALMAHDCVANTHLSVDDNFQMTIRASVDIPQGQPILYNYTDPLQTTPERQRHLQEGKYFTCSCRRCEDPTELDTYLSALKCPRCKTGRALACPQGGNWTCESCNKTFRCGLMTSSLSLARDYMETVDRRDPQQLETAISRLSSTLVPSHSLLMDLKQSIVAVYREQEPTTRTMLRKVELCRELLPILRQIEPGISRMTGITLYELHIALVSLGEMHHLREAEELLKEALNHLLYEPSKSPEGELARQAMHELKTLKQMITRQDLKEKKKKDKQKKIK